MNSTTYEVGTEIYPWAKFAALEIIDVDEDINNAYGTVMQNTNISAEGILSYN
jgi:hypothetical protein